MRGRRRIIQYILKKLRLRPPTSSTLGSVHYLSSRSHPPSPDSVLVSVGVSVGCGGDGVVLGFGPFGVVNELIIGSDAVVFLLLLYLGVDHVDEGIFGVSFRVVGESIIGLAAVASLLLYLNAPNVIGFSRGAGKGKGNFGCCESGISMTTACLPRYRYLVGY